MRDIKTVHLQRTLVLHDRCLVLYRANHIRSMSCIVKHEAGKKSIEAGYGRKIIRPRLKINVRILPSFAEYSASYLHIRCHSGAFLHQDEHTSVLIEPQDESKSKRRFFLMRLKWPYSSSVLLSCSCPMLCPAKTRDPELE
jgi:hypothetical protein